MNRIYVTMICPEALMALANAALVTIMDEAAFACTFQKARWQDQAGSAYAVAGFLIDAEQLRAMAKPPHEEALMPEIWHGQDEVPLAKPDRLTCICAISSITAVATSGLKRADAA